MIGRRFKGAFEPGFPGMTEAEWAALEKSHREESQRNEKRWQQFFREMHQQEDLDEQEFRDRERKMLQRSRREIGLASEARIAARIVAGELDFPNEWEKGYHIGTLVASFLDWSIESVLGTALQVARQGGIPALAALAPRFRAGVAGDTMERLYPSIKQGVAKIMALKARYGDWAVLGAVAGVLEDANVHKEAGLVYDLAREMNKSRTAASAQWVKEISYGLAVAVGDIPAYQTYLGTTLFIERSKSFLKKNRREIIEKRGPKEYDELVKAFDELTAAWDKIGGAEELLAQAQHNLATLKQKYSALRQAVLGWD